MKDFPLVSIVTPCYNAAQYIRETIDSVRQQDYPNIEHIIVDGMSTDGTVEILKNNTDVIWISEPDDGQSNAINKGLLLCKGEIIGWLNADDIYRQHAIQLAVEYLELNPSVDMVYGDVNVIDENGALIGISKSQDFDLFLLLEVNYIKQPSVFIRRRVIEQVGKLNKKLHYVMDWEFWLRAGIIGINAKYMDGRILADFRKCDGTKSFELGPRFQQEWGEVLQNILADSFFDSISASRKYKLLRQNKIQYYLALATQIGEKRGSNDMLIYVWKTLCKEPSLILSKKTLYIILTGLLRRQLDWKHKFKL